MRWSLQWPNVDWIFLSFLCLSPYGWIEFHEIVLLLNSVKIKFLCVKILLGEANSSKKPHGKSSKRMHTHMHTHMQNCEVTSLPALHVEFAQELHFINLPKVGNSSSLCTRAYVFSSQILACISPRNSKGLQWKKISSCFRFSLCFVFPESLGPLQWNVAVSFFSSLLSLESKPNS